MRKVVKIAAWVPIVIGAGVVIAGALKLTPKEASLLDIVGCSIVLAMLAMTIHSLR